MKKISNMTRGQQKANRLREVILDGKFIANTNWKAAVSDLTWNEATHRIYELNSVADLTFHIQYYINGVLKVLKGGNLDIRDKYSFDYDPPVNQSEWQKLQDSLYVGTSQFADLLSKLDDAQLDREFIDSKYGSYDRNMEAMIEHCYYHFGQIIIIKKMLGKSDK